MNQSKILKACLNWKVLLGLGVVVLLAYVFVPQIANYAWLLLVLACPLSMVFMMTGMKHVEPEKAFVCAECDLSYKESEWAKRCATWCKEHHSCNLEITEHAIKDNNYINMENNQPVEQSSKKESYGLERQEKLEQKEKVIKKQQIKHVLKWSFGIALVVLPIGGLIWYSVTRPPIPESEIASRNGLHWHPEIVIYVKGVKQETPANLGVRPSFMAPVHTHEPNGVIHLEFQGLVRKDAITLGQFFKSWGKDIQSFGTNMTMTVNGKENIEYENYIMQDTDKIELRYE